LTPAEHNLARWRRLAFGFLIIAWFLYFNWAGLWAHFAADDMMNMDLYWRMSPARLLLDHLMPWRGSFRPMGALFYLPLLAIFGLNPVPYHAVLLVLLIVNLYLMYRFARIAGAGELEAGLATLIVAYHSGLSMLYYSTAFIYDVLCFFFYMAALLCYARARMQGRVLRPGETALMLALYLCALNSKEMALSLPLALAAWEFWCAPRKALRAADVARPIFFAVLLSAIYLYGRVFSPDAILKTQAYRPVFTIHQFFFAQKTYLAELFLSDGRFSWRGVVAMWLLLVYLAWRRPRPVLRFCFVFLMVTPLPIVFLEGRSAACLYIPLAGWAVFAAITLTDIARAAADFLSREPLLRRAGRNSLLAAILAAAFFFWAKEIDRRRREYAWPAMADVGRLTAQVLEQMRALQPRIEPYSQAVFLNDPFVDWDMSFIADLWFRDHTMHFHLQRFTPIPDEEQKKMHVFDFQNGRLVMLR
jgi:hypothetical protein